MDKHWRAQLIMARYIRNIVLNKPADFVAFMMNDYLQKNGFSFFTWKYDAAFRAGDGIIESYKYLKWGYDGCTLHVEAWVRDLFGIEIGLDGLSFTLQRSAFRKSLEQLFVLLNQNIPMPPQPAYDTNGQPVPQPVPIQTADNSSAAVMALVFGIITLSLTFIYFVSLIISISAFTFIFPVVILFVGTLGISRARLGGGSSQAKLALAGKILSMVAVGLICIFWGVIILFAIF